MPGLPKRERTRRHLIATGFEVLAERGDALTATDVITAAEVSNGTFYNHFADREAFIQALAHEVLTALADTAAEETAGADPAHRFAVATCRVLRAAVADPVLARAMLRLAEQDRPPQDEVRRHLRADLAQGCATGRFRYGDDPVTLDLVTGTLMATIRRITVGRAGETAVAPTTARLLAALGVDPDEAEALAASAAAADATDPRTRNGRPAGRPSTEPFS